MIAVGDDCSVEGKIWQCYSPTIQAVQRGRSVLVRQATKETLAYLVNAGAIAARTADPLFPNCWHIRRSHC